MYVDPGSAFYYGCPAPYYRSNSESEGGTWPGDERKIGSNCHVKQNISHGFKFLLATENVYG